MDSKEGLGGGGFVVLGGKSSRELKNVCREEGGVEKMSSTGSKFMLRGEECLEGYVGAGGGEVNGGGDDFGVSKSLLGEIPRVVIVESGGETFKVDGGAVWHIEMVEGMLRILCLFIEQDLQELMHYLPFLLKFNH
ncbi:hypothetical protein Tco_0313827 [Tanacetum coccineum]